MNAVSVVSKYTFSAAYKHIFVLLKLTKLILTALRDCTPEYLTENKSILRVGIWFPYFTFEVQYPKKYIPTGN